MSERNPLWKQVTIGKYGQAKKGRCTKEVTEGYGVNVWKIIKGGWEALKDRIGFKVGSYNRGNFG